MAEPGYESSPSYAEVARRASQDDSGAAGATHASNAPASGARPQAPASTPTSPPASHSGPASGGACRSHKCGQMCHDMLSWNNPIHSGIGLAVVNVAFLLVMRCYRMFMALTSWIGIIAMVGGFVASLLFEKREARVELVTKKQIEDASVRIYEGVNHIATTGRSVLLWEDRAVSGLVCVFLLLSGWLLNVLPLWFVVLLVLNVILSFKVLSQAYKQYVAPHTNKVMRQLNTALSKIPRRQLHSKTQ